MTETDVLIVGGGLAGLSLASALSDDGRDWHLIEARDRIGGRILSADAGGARFDLGPSWFWPGQPRIAGLVGKLGLRAFEQPVRGIVVVEEASGQVRQGPGFAAMQGSLRLDGGMASLTDALVRTLPSLRIHVDTLALAIRRCADGVEVSTPDGTLFARRVVLAMPPRLVADLTFEPALPEEVLSVLRNTPTWMAGHAKAMAIYPTAFWRDVGLSGDAMSRRGPLVEIHDASPMRPTLGALFGFVGVPPEARADRDALINAIRDQLVRLFGAAASDPREIVVQDWAAEPCTATDRDRSVPFAHPTIMNAGLLDHWDGVLRLAGTETAPQTPGLIEGALESAAGAFHALCKEKGLADGT